MFCFTFYDKQNSNRNRLATISLYITSEITSHVFGAILKVVIDNEIDCEDANIFGTGSPIMLICRLSATFNMLAITVNKQKHSAMLIANCTLRNLPAPLRSGLPKHAYWVKIEPPCVVRFALGYVNCMRDLPALAVTVFSYVPLLQLAHCSNPACFITLILATIARERAIAQAKTSGREAAASRSKYEEWLGRTALAIKKTRSYLAYIHRFYIETESATTRWSTLSSFSSLCFHYKNSALVADRGFGQRMSRSLTLGQVAMVPLGKIVEDLSLSQVATRT